MKGQLLHRARAHLKVPGWSLVWNELLTKKLPMFLSRLNDMSGGCEKIVPVSGSFWSNIQFLRIMDLTMVVRVKRVSEWNAVGTAHSFCDVCSDGFARGGDPLERHKRGNHVFRKTGTLTLVCGNNRSHRYINDEVLETEKRESNS